MSLKGAITMSKNTIKMINETFLYKLNQSRNDAAIKTYLTNAPRIDRNTEGFKEFETIVNSYINSKTIIDSTLNADQVVFTMGETPMSFTVLTAKDILKDNKHKIFVSLLPYVRYETKDSNVEGGLSVSNRDIDKLISRLYSVINHQVYYSQYKKLSLDSTILETGAEIFASLYGYIFNYLYKINQNDIMFAKVKYLAARYYLEGILNIERENIHKYALSISKLTERQANVIDISKTKDNTFSDLQMFTKAVADVTGIDVKLDAFIEKWSYVFSSTTFYALESFTHFADLVSNVYVGAYANNQKTIEKICGIEMIKEFTLAIHKLNRERLS
jgi:hypothetical protein